MTHSDETPRESMIPSVIVMFAITGALFLVVSTVFTLGIATRACTGTCTQDALYRVSAVYPVIAWPLFAAAVVGSLLLRNRRWWVAAPPAAALILVVITALVMPQVVEAG